MSVPTALLIAATASSVFALLPITYVGYRSTSTTDLLLVGVLRELRLFEAEGITPEFLEFHSPQEVGLSLMTGRVDISLFVGYEHALLMAASEPKGWRAIAAVVEQKRYPHYFLIARTGSGVGSVDELVGKRFGYMPPTPTMKAHVEAVVRHFMIRGVTVLPLSSNTVLPALAMGTIDVVFAPEPVRSRVIIEGSGQILNHRRGLMAEIYGEPYPVLLSITRPRISEEVVQKARRAFDVAIEYVRQNPKESRERLSRILKGVDGRAVASTLQLPSYQKLTEVDYAQYNAVYQAQRATGFLRDPVDLASLLR